MAWLLHAGINMDEEKRAEAAKIEPTCKGGKKNRVGENQETAGYAVQNYSHEDEGRGGGGCIRLG